MLELTGSSADRHAIRSRSRAWFAAILLVVALGITDRADSGARSALDRDASEYVRLAVALGERDPDSLDFYTGPPALVADVRRDPPPLAAIKRSAEVLVARLEHRKVGDALRQRRLIQHLRAVSARVDLLLGARPVFDDESRSFFGVAPPPQDDRRFAEIRAQLNTLLPGGGPLVERYVAFDRHFIVPPNRLPATFERALAECRRRTLSHISLPGGESVSIQYVRNKPWSAYSRYLGGGRSSISVNTDFQFTVDRLLQVACHEAYPGHHTREVLLDAASPRRLEASVRPLFSPETLVAEGGAMYAVELAFNEDERIDFERRDLVPAAGIRVDEVSRAVRVARLIEELQDVQVQIARRYLDGALEFVRASAALRDEALNPEPDATLKYINEFRSYVTAYTTGRQAASRFISSCTGSGDRNRSWVCFEQLLTSDALVPVGH